MFIVIISYQLVFVGENGADGGGLTREFFRLVSYSTSMKYIDSGCLRHNSIDYQVCNVILP